MNAEFVGICVAINNGDDTAIGVLADWYEERGSPLAAGLRVILASSPFWQPVKWKASANSPPGDRYWWLYNALPSKVFNKLSGQVVSDKHGDIGHGYETRSYAYLDLARALALLDEEEDDDDDDDEWHDHADEYEPEPDDFDDPPYWGEDPDD